MSNIDHSGQLGEEKISKLLLKFSIPAITGMIVNALYNLIDRIFIGNSAGSLGIAGITIGFPIMLLIMGFTLLTGLGATSLVSIKLGEQKKDEAEKVVGNALSMLIIIDIIITVGGLIFLTPILKVFGASDAVLPFARDYMAIILAGSVFQAIGFGMNNFIRAEGNPKKAMFTMLISALINAVLAPIFIFIFNWGIKGAALATIIAQLFSAVWVLSHFLTGKSIFKIKLKNLILKPVIIKSIVAIGVAPFVLQVAASLFNVIMNKELVKYGGDIAVSGMGIVNSIMTLVMMPIFGINQGVQPIIGYNYGAMKYDRVVEALKSAIIAATSIVVVGFIATRLFPTQLVSIFNSKDKELLAFGTHAIKIFMLGMPVIGMQIIGTVYFQAVGKVKQAMILSLSRQCLILIPAMLILPIFYKLEGVLIAGPLADYLAAIITGTWLFFELKNLTRKHEISTHANAIIDIDSIK